MSKNQELQNPMQVAIQQVQQHPDPYNYPPQPQQPQYPMMQTSYVVNADGTVSIR